MDMIPLRSSALLSAGYDPATATLFLQFTSGYYIYYGVPSMVYLGLLTAPSHGQYFHQAIRDRFEYTRLSPPKNQTGAERLFP